MKLHWAVLATALLLGPLSTWAQQAGRFDYYVLNLSWSPEYCYSHQGSPECGKKLGFIVHGLWPQYNNAGRGPEHCGNQPGLSDPGRILNIMPDTGLIQHEWESHGTCSGLSANDYFDLILTIYRSVTIPPQFQNATHSFILRAADVKRAFEQANPSLNDAEISFTCAGQYLREVEICFSKEGKPQPCSGLRACTARTVHVNAPK
jgi:ribonuclease T2